jgi:hypothetical protein
MQHFSKEQIRQARKVNLYDFILTYHSGDFRRDGTSIHPRANRSLSIKQGYCGYIDFATDDKGNSVDFLTKYLGYELDNAVFALCGEGYHLIGSTQERQQIRLEKASPQFPKPIEASYKQLFAYLISRGISTGTIKMLIDLKIIYQDTYNNIIFVNSERDWGERRGTNTYADARCLHRSECQEFRESKYGWCSCMNDCIQYKNDAYHSMIANSREDGFWWFKIGDGNSEKVYVCEASIDAISLYELHRLNGIKENVVFVSIGGVAKQKTIDRLKQHSRVMLAVDNDNAGSECRKRNSELECIIPRLKDWNDDLKALLKQS